MFTPYLGGERTPHDDPELTACFSSLTHATGPLHLAQSVMEGVALALADGHDALIGDGARIDRVVLTGGGARSLLWARLIAAAIGIPVATSAGARSGPAIGAARLARRGLGGPLLAIAGDDPGARAVEVEPALREALLAKRRRFHAHLGLAGAAAERA